MKEINMYVKSSCKYLREDRLGVWVTVLEYKGRTKTFRGSDFNTTDRRMLWMGLIEGIKNLKEPCKINIYTAGSIGMKGNTNKDLREKFLNEIYINKHEFKMFVTKDNDYKMIKLAKDYYKELCNSFNFNDSDIID